MNERRESKELRKVLVRITVANGGPGGRCYKPEISPERRLSLSIATFSRARPGAMIEHFLHPWRKLAMFCSMLIVRIVRKVKKRGRNTSFLSY